MCCGDRDLPLNGMKIIFKLLVTALGLLAVTELVGGFVVESFYIALIVALLLGIVNVTLKPLVVLLTLPLHILTLGLFMFVVNALMLWFISSFVSGFVITSFLSAILGALLVSLFSFLGEKIIEGTRN